jgi:hypothetical protein
MQLVSSRAVSLLKLRAVTTDGGCSCSSWVCRCKMRCVAGEGVGLSRGEKTTAVALPWSISWVRAVLRLFATAHWTFPP